jgi:nucleotide-binding universal stress UspA family protein
MDDQVNKARWIAVLALRVTTLGHVQRGGAPGAFDRDEVLTYAQQQKIDLICLGARGSGWSLGKLFGSNVDRVLRQAPCPVLVARPNRQPESSYNELVESVSSDRK